ncbi:SDR family NAD(P)-dependent oxidoreductase [Pseudoalteromonas sp. C2R02]|uniref:SDR family NAD(P)-dependent oxidoreductase n=1 Tax=Pseudoalteromonas sp. C2R02 TaxID=2841565 RepID=UPI001C09BDFF|nr:SDR family NAD(P)-dependent oxidoreductase [Pseudoalteromonas sp. C2R02]MBU2967957.1 SDR family NAD(P)-dependent oxidoreductase [Pseudoalteromonas sp. C2R02]
MKHILITGASSGIGKALASLYANEGHTVYAGGRDFKKLNLLCRSNNKIRPFICDVTDINDIQLASKNLPKLDIIILNAGDCEYIDDPINFDGQLFARVINTNLISVGYCLQVLLKHLKPNGNLAFTSSSAAFLPLTRTQAYGASKAGLNYLAKSLSIDLKTHNINVSLINPGFVSTPLTDKNTFSMPGIISSDLAAKYIVKGLNKNKSEINIPPLFTFIMKLFSYLPFFIWQKIAVRMIQK